MVSEHTPQTPTRDSKELTLSDARLNVLYSPFRKREVNPEDWESKMSFWKSKITNWCFDCKICVFNVAKLQSTFLRNGRPASCLETVIDNMISNNEVILLQDFLNQSPAQTWSSWAVNSFIKTPIVWSFTKLKESLIAKQTCGINEELVHIDVLKNYSDDLRKKCASSSKAIFTLDEVKSFSELTDATCVKAVLHWMQLQGQATVMTVFNRTIVKIGEGNEKAKPISEADFGLYQLQQNEQALKRTLEQLELEKQQTEDEARSYLRQGMRQTAKSCLRKKKELEKCIDKRAAALDNVQVLLSRVKEAESDKEILDSYKLGLSALKATFKDAGLSEDGVSQTMDQVQEVLEVHQEIQSELAKPMGESYEADLESELAELLAAGGKVDTSPPKLDVSLPDLPEPPTHSPSFSTDRIKPRVAEKYTF